jgi:hypothetical protein
MLVGLSAVIAASLLGSGTRAEQQSGADQQLSDQQAGQQRYPAPSAALNEFHTQYAAMSLQLANLELKRAMDVNRRIPNTFSQAAIAALRQSANIAQLHVDLIEKKAKDPLYGLYIGSEEASMKIAQEEYQSALGTNERVRNTYTGEDLDRLRLTYEVAKLRWENARELENQPPITRIEWQIELMREEVVRLRARVEQLRRLN